MYVLPWKPPEGKRICYGGVADDNHVFIPSSGWHEMIESGYEFNENGVVVCDNEAVYLGCLYYVWGHAITDNFKKAWYLLENPPKDRELVYITVGNTPLPQYVFDLFDLIGINLRQAVHITQITKYKNIIVPENSLVNNNEVRSYNQEFARTIQKLTSKIPIDNNSPAKIYFTRTRLKQNRDIGEKSVEHVFRKKGFAIIAPEMLSVVEQMALVRNCKVFASTEGSVSHSSIFCKPRTEIILVKKTDYINPYTSFINDMLDLKCTFIRAHHSVLAPQRTPWEGPFFLYKSRDLMSFCGGFFLRPYFMYFSWYEYRWKLWTRIKNAYYSLRAFCGIRTKISQWFR